MKIVAALSGGVDSSVAAALALRDGAEVVGVTLALKHPDPAFSAAQKCAGERDAEAAAAVCRKLAVPHVVLDRFPLFRDRVLRPSAETYLAGRTPNPCCFCNALVKFAALLDYAREIGAEKVVTGHYARIAGGRLRRGVDSALVRGASFRAACVRGSRAGGCRKHDHSRRERQAVLCAAGHVGRRAVVQQGAV